MDVASPYLTHPDVTAGLGLFVGDVPWDRGERDITFTTFGIDPGQREFLEPEIASDAALLQMQDVALLDRLARGMSRDEAAAIRPQTPLSFGTKGRTLTALDTFAGGGGFGGDGFMLVSDQTFLSLFPDRSSAAPDHILLRLRPGADVEAVAKNLRGLITDKTLRDPASRHAPPLDRQRASTPRMPIADRRSGSDAVQPAIGVALCPVAAILVSQPMPKQEAEQLLLGYLHGIHRLLASADQVDHGFLLLIRRPDRCQFPCTPQPCKHFSVPTVRLHTIPNLAGDHRGRNNGAFKAEFREKPMQAIPTGTRLVAKAWCVACSRKLLGQPQNRTGSMRNRAKKPHLTTAAILRNGNSNRIFMNV